jgi:hypothetical protein
MAYKELLEKAREGTFGVDFTKLRYAYVKSPQFDPYTDKKTEYLNLIKEVSMEGFDNKNAARVISALNHALDDDYLEIAFHNVASTIYEKLGHQEKAKYHHRFAEGLIDSILGSGDGGSFDSAYQVITVSEEYAILESMEAICKKQHTVERGGHIYDVLEVVNEDDETEEVAKLYFNIDVPRGWLRRESSKSPNRENSLPPPNLDSSKAPNLDSSKAPNRESSKAPIASDSTINQQPIWRSLMNYFRKEKGK